MNEQEMNDQGMSAEGDDDLRALFRKYPPPPVERRSVERIAARALGRIRRRRAHLRMAGAVVLLGAAAALVVLARAPWWGAVDRTGEPPGTARRTGQRTGLLEDQQTVAHEIEGIAQPAARTGRADPRPVEQPDPPSVVTRALQMTVELRTRRRAILDDLRREGPPVVKPLIDALRSREQETVLAAAHLLGALATSEADAAIRGMLEEGSGKRSAGGSSPGAVEALVEELLKRRDRAGRRLVRDLVETPLAGGLIVRSVGREHGLVATDLLEEAGASATPSLAAEAIAFLSDRRPSRAASAFWIAAERFGSAGRTEADGRHGARGEEPAPDLTAFLREALPKLSARTLAHIEDDLRSDSPRGANEASRRMARAAAVHAPESWRASLPEALGRAGAPEAWPLLAALAETAGATPSVLRAFGSLGDARAVPVLERSVYLHGERARAAIASLARIPGPDALGALLEAYLNLDRGGGQYFPETQALLAGSLRKRRDETLAELRARLGGEPHQHALDAFIELFPETAGSELAALLPTVDRPSRPLVFRALAGLGTPDAVRILIGALEEPASRRMARQALTRIARRDLGPRVESWTAWAREKFPDAGPRAERFDSGRGGELGVLALRENEHHKEGA